MIGTLLLQRQPHNIPCSLQHVVELVLTSMGCTFLYATWEKAEQKEPGMIT